MSPVIDLIIRIKNGYLSKRETIEAKYSKFGESVLVKLKKLKYIEDFEVEGEVVKTITITLAYDEYGDSKFTDVKIVSKPGQRMYTAAKDLKPVLSGLGFGILSTPKGILTNIEAKREKTGGELLFLIW